MSIHHAQPFTEDDAPWDDDHDEADYSPMTHIHEPLVGILAAEALTHVAGRTLQMVDEQFKINNVTAAVGAIAATECNLNMARDYLSRAEELIEEGEGVSHEFTGATRELTKLLDQYETNMVEHAETAAKRSNYQNFNESMAPWYCHRFQIAHSLTGTQLLLTRMATLPDDADNLDQERYAHILAAYDVSITPEVVPQHPDPQAALRQPDGYTSQRDKIERQAQSAAAEMSELMERAQRKFAQSIPTVVSPVMSAVPDIAEQLTANPVGVNACRIGFVRAGEEPEKGPIEFTIDELNIERLKEEILSEVPLQYVAFIHDALHYVISIGEPYPPGFPAQQVMQHMEAARQQLEAAAPGMSEALYLDYEKAINAAESAADEGVHCLAPQAVNAFLEQAKQMGMPRGIRRLLMEGLSNYDLYLADRLLGERAEHHWHDRLCSRRAGRQIINTARQAGLDEYLLAELAETLGFEPQQMGVHNHRLGNRKLRELQRAAQEAGIDDASWERMEENLLLDHH